MTRRSAWLPCWEEECGSNGGAEVDRAVSLEPTEPCSFCVSDRRPQVGLGGARSEGFESCQLLGKLRREDSMLGQRQV